MAKFEVISPIRKEWIRLGDDEPRWRIAFSHHHEASDTLYLTGVVRFMDSPDHQCLINERPIGPVRMETEKGAVLMEIPDGVLRQGGNELEIRIGAIPGTTDLDTFEISDLAVRRRLQPDGSGHGGSDSGGGGA